MGRIREGFEKEPGRIREGHPHIEQLICSAGVGFRPIVLLTAGRMCTEEIWGRIRKRVEKELGRMLGGFGRLICKAEK